MQIVGAVMVVQLVGNGGRRCWEELGIMQWEKHHNKVALSSPVCHDLYLQGVWFTGYSPRMKMNDKTCRDLEEHWKDRR